MIRSYCLDLRERVVAAVDAGMSRRAAARHFAVSESSAVRWAGRSAGEGHVRHDGWAVRRARAL